MFDAMRIGIPRGIAINESFLEGMHSSGRPTISYQRPIVIREEGFSIMLSSLRTDGYIETATPFVISFNGFEVGSQERVNRTLAKIVGSEYVNRLFPQYSEVCLDFQIESLPLIKSVVPTKNLGMKLWKSFVEDKPHLKEKELKELPFLEHYKRTGTETFALGTARHYQVQIYNKYKQLLDQGKKILEERNDLSPFTRIEIKLGRRFMGDYSWGELEKWIKKARPFADLMWKNVQNDIFDVQADSYSVEGLSRLGALSLMRNYDIPQGILLKKIKKRPAWEKEFLQGILQEGEPVKMPDLDTLFQESVSRFFYKDINSSLPILLWNKDGTGYKKVPPEIFLLRKKKKVIKPVRGSNEEHE